MSIKAEKQSINDIFDKFWFEIPSYQRHYVWKSDNINDLLEDLWFAFENKREDDYFLGSLVLQQTEQKSYEEYVVLDGQQRLTSLLILMAILRDMLEENLRSYIQLKDAFRERVYQEENKGKGIPERKRIIYKIRGNVATFVDDFIIKEQGTIQTADIKNHIKDENVSISHMANAILTIQQFFSGDVKKSMLYDFGVYVGLRPVFVCVSSDDKTDAFRLFTILNNRGIPLANADILKAINIAEVNQEEEHDYAEIWEEIENNHGEDFDRFLSIIRTMFVKEKARENLVDEFEKNIYQGLLKKGKDTIDYIKKVNEHYQKLINLSDKNLSNYYKNLITIMNTAIPSKDWVAPLLAFYSKFGDVDLLKFLKKLEFKFSSDWILGYTPTKRIENMNAILKEIEKSKSADDVLSSPTLCDVKVDDLRDTLNREVYGKSFAKYILLKYEYLSLTDTASISDYKSVSIEHVLPQNPKKDSKWLSDFDKDEKENWTHKLANLLLISGRKNPSLSNYDFQDKKSRYLTGKIDIFKSSNIFATHDKWDIETLEKRQEQMLDELAK